MGNLSEQAIKSCLKGNFGTALAVYQVVDSTNQAAKLLAKNGAPHGAVVTAAQQTAGKGRLGRSFYSPESQGVYLSVILRPRCCAERSMLMTSAASVAVAKAIQVVSGVFVQIKWVNDLYWNGKKLCGILTESALKPDGTMEYAVIGMGVNITNKSFPAELSEKATSLAAAGCADLDQNRLIAEIINQLELVYGQLDSREFLTEYRSRSCVLGKTVQIVRGSKCYKAKAVSIDDDAHLLVQTAAGETISLSSGEISLKGNWS